MGTRADTAVRSSAARIGTFQLMMFGVGATVGTGIFFVLQESVPDAGPAVVVSFLLAGLAAGLSALCYAEMASSIPVSGSTYSYAYHSMGELVAMVIAACVLLEYGVAAAAVAVGWSGYFNELLDKTIGWQHPGRAVLLADPRTRTARPGWSTCRPIVLVFLCTLLLIRGASESAKVNTVMVLIKLERPGPVHRHRADGVPGRPVRQLLGIRVGGHQRPRPARSSSRSSGSTPSRRPARRSRIPQRALPRAIMGALVIVVTVYVLVAIAGVGAQPLAEFSSTEQQSAGLSVILENVTGSAVPGHDPGRRRRDLDLLGHPGHALRADPHPVRDGPRPDAARQVRRGEPAHADPDLQHRSWSGSSSR